MSESPRRPFFLQPLDGGDYSSQLEESHMCSFLLSLAISRDIRCGCDFYAVLSSPHSPCVAHFYHLLRATRHSAVFPSHSFSWAFTPTSGCWFTASNLLQYRDRESRPPFQEQSRERGPEKASVMSLGVRSEFLFEDFYHL